MTLDVSVKSARRAALYMTARVRELGRGFPNSRVASLRTALLTFLGIEDAVSAGVLTVTTVYTTRCIFEQRNASASRHAIPAWSRWHGRVC